MPGTGPIRSPAGMLQSANTLTVEDARVACMARGEIRTMKAGCRPRGKYKVTGGGGRGGEEEEEESEDRPISALGVTRWRFALRLF